MLPLGEFYTLLPHNGYCPLSRQENIPPKYTAGNNFPASFHILHNYIHLLHMLHSYVLWKDLRCFKKQNIQHPPDAWKRARHLIFEVDIFCFCELYQIGWVIFNIFMTRVLSPGPGGRGRKVGFWYIYLKTITKSAARCSKMDHCRKHLQRQLNIFEKSAKM